MKINRIYFILFLAIIVPFGSHCESKMEGGFDIENDMNFRRLNRKDYEHPLSTYMSPSINSNKVCTLPNGYLVRCLEETSEGWWLLEFEKGNDRICAYAMVEAEELVSITDIPPAHPVYCEAFLELEGGFAYRFGTKAPAQLLDALERAEVDFDSVYCGSISSIDSKIAAMIVETGHEKVLCLLSKSEGVWTLVGVNRKIYRKNAMPLSYFEFTMDGKLAFHLNWLGVPSVRCLLSTSEGSFSPQWYFECIMLCGGDNRLSRNIRVVPLPSNLSITGTVSVNSVISEVNELVPSRDYRFFVDMDCIEIETLLRTHFSEFFMPVFE